MGVMVVPPVPGDSSFVTETVFSVKPQDFEAKSPQMPQSLLLSLVSGPGSKGIVNVQLM